MNKKQNDKVYDNSKDLSDLDKIKGRYQEVEDITGRIYEGEEIKIFK